MGADSLARDAAGGVGGVEKERGEQPIMRLTQSTLPLFMCLASGCGSASRVVVLQHPETKQTVQCKVEPVGDTTFNRQQIESCVRAYEQAGYRVVGDSDK